MKASIGSPAWGDCNPACGDRDRFHRPRQSKVVHRRRARCRQSIPAVGCPLSRDSAEAISGLEFVGGIVLLVGLLSRPVAALLAIDMAGAVDFVAHANRGFFPKAGAMNTR
jgi:uncharacterized membrane protein YphA (DoxX/SURF4 family)